MRPAQDIGNVLLVLSVVPAVLSVLVFSQVTWWRSAWGRHLFVYMVSVALVLALAALRLQFGDAAWFYWLRLGAYGLAVIALWWRLLILWASYREGSPDEGDLSKRQREDTPR